MTETYFRRGFGLKSAIEGQLTADYHSAVVDALRSHGHVLTAGPLTFCLAQEFGFCYGVDRAVDYAYETRHKFPDRRIFLAGEIIHNPHVNQKLEAMGIGFLHRDGGGDFDFSAVGATDVVIMPADRSWKAQTTWPRGDTELVVKPDMGVHGDASYFISVNGNESAVAISTVPASLSTDQMRAAWMLQKGCAPQAEALLRASR